MSDSAPLPGSQPAQAFARHLVDSGWLAQRLDDPSLRVFDCTTHLRPDPPAVYRVESGRADYDAGHIPGAGFIDLQEELSDAASPLRFMRPDAEQFAAVMGAKGIGAGTRVVLYSTTTPQWATRVWWMLRAFGFDDAMVLDGGLRKWRAEGREITTEPCRYPPARFVPAPREGLFVDRDEVLAALGAGVCVLNSLSAEQHRGTSGLHYGRPGRIAGSVNVPAAQMLDESGCYLAPERLARAFAESGVDPGRRVLTYCGGGIAASSSAFILTLLGYRDVGLYDASLSEWARDEALPMETGDPAGSG